MRFRKSISLLLFCLIMMMSFYDLKVFSSPSAIGRYLDGVLYINQQDGTKFSAYDENGIAIEKKFDGRWACGATTSVMLVNYFGKLPQKTLRDETNPGAYVAQDYEVDKNSFSGEYTKSRTTDIFGGGAYGFIHRKSDQNAIIDEARRYYSFHGLETEVIKNFDYTSFKSMIDNGYLCYMRTRIQVSSKASNELWPHIVLAKGYMEWDKKQYLIVNDPWFNGKVKYDFKKSPEDFYNSVQNWNEISGEGLPYLWTGKHEENFTVEGPCKFINEWWAIARDANKKVVFKEIGANSSSDTCEIMIKANWEKSTIEIPYELLYEDNSIGNFTTKATGDQVHKDMKPGKYSVKFAKNHGLYTLKDPPNGMRSIYTKSGEFHQISARYDKAPTGSIYLEANTNSNSSIVVPLELIGPDKNRNSYNTPLRLNDVPIGDYTVHWKDIEGAYPDGYSTSFTVVENQTYVFSKRYIEGEKKVPGPSYIQISASVHHKDEGKGSEDWTGFRDIQADRYENGKVVQSVIAKDLRIPNVKIDIPPGKWKISLLGNKTLVKTVNGKSKSALFHFDPDYPIDIAHGETGSFHLHFVFPEEKKNTGTIKVESNVKGASFSVSGASSFSGTTPDSKDDRTAATYTISWKDVEGYQKPKDETLRLTAGATITFYGEYKKNSGGDKPPPKDPPKDPPKEAKMSIIVYESVDKNPVTGAKVVVKVGSVTKSGTTNKDGELDLTAPAGLWELEVSLAGFETYTESFENQGTAYPRVYLQEKKGGGGGGGTTPPASKYEVGNWISIGPNCYYYDAACGNSLNRFDYENGYKITEKKFCDDRWWYKVWMEDDDGVQSQHVWIRGVDVNKQIAAPKYNKGSEYEFKKDSPAYDRVDGSEVNRLKYDGNRFKILDIVYRNGTWWYKVYVTPWSRNVWFKEAAIK